MNSKKTRGKRQIAAEYAMIIFGSLLYVCALKVFITPNQIPSGGVGGLALLANYMLGLPIGVISIALNVPLLIFGYKMLGRDFFFKTMFMTVFSSVLIDVVNFLPAYEGDVMLACLFGGVIKGIAFGLIIRAGGSSGGSDVIGKYFYRVRSVPLGTTAMSVNICVLILSALMLKSLESLMYGIITQYALSAIMDTIIYGGDIQKNAMIITKKPEEVAEAIMRNIGHGVTALEGRGMYTGEERTVLMCVVRRHETNAVKKTILDIDESAFMILSDANEVLGRGFKHLSID